jgi:hypothetical protein
MKFLSLLLFTLLLPFYSAMSQPALKWQRCSGGTESDQSVSIAATNDNGVVVIGGAYSSDGDILSSHGGDDVFLLRLDSINNIVWKKTYGGSLDDVGFNVIKLSDLNFLLVAGTESNDGDVSNNHGMSDIWMVKIDSLEISSGRKLMEEPIGKTLCQ